MNGARGTIALLPREIVLNYSASAEDLMATKTADKFKCPKCGSGRTKPISIAISSGTRRRNTVGVSRRSMWGSSSTYKSDLVSSLLNARQMQVLICSCS